MNGQLGLWTMGFIAIAWLLVAWTVQSLSAQRWWWLLAETAVAVLAHDLGWWGLERFHRSSSDGQTVMVATILSFTVIATLVLLLSQVLLPAIASRARAANVRSHSVPVTDADKSIQIAFPALPRRRRWELVVHVLLMTLTNVLWGGALGLYSPP
ncbi:MAG: hypothetical protein AAF704_13740 [Cyanobacteria bacterium P01_D01_bin.123]